MTTKLKPAVGATAAFLLVGVVSGCSSTSTSAATGGSGSSAPATAATSTAAATSAAASSTAASGAVPSSAAASSTGSGGASSSLPAPDPGSSSTKIVYIPGLTGNPFYNTVACGASSEAKKLGVSFAYQGDSTFGVPQQTKVLNAVVATKPSAIMISITDPVAMVGPLTAAKQAGIKIVGIDGDLQDTSVMVTNIQSDGVAGGAMAGEALAKAVGGKGDVLVIDNATGSVVSQARVDGFKQAIAKYPGMKVLDVQYSNNDVSKAASFVSTSATNDPNLVGVFGVETNNTQGAITGVRESGKTGKVKVVGYDISDPIQQALKDGTLAGTVVQYPRGEGVLGVDSALDALQGKSVPRNQAAPALFVTPDNYTSATAQQYIYDVNCKM